MIHDRSTFENTYDLPGKCSGDEGAGIACCLVQKHRVWQVGSPRLPISPMAY